MKHARTNRKRFRHRMADASEALKECHDIAMASWQHQPVALRLRELHLDLEILTRDINQIVSWRRVANKTKPQEEVNG